MSLLAQLCEEAQAAALDVDAAVFVFGADDLDVQLLEQRAREKTARADALEAQAEVLAERHAGPRLRDPLAGWRPVVR